MPNAAFHTLKLFPSLTAARFGFGVMRVIKRVSKRCCLFLLWALCAMPLFAQQSAVPSSAPASPASSNAAPQYNSKAVNDTLAALDRRVTAAQSSGDNAWMLVSAALVLMMTGPGLALFYGGLVRRKNTLAIMMQSFAMMALITVLWALVGYSLCFG